MNALLHRNDCPDTIALLDALLPTRQHPSYNVEDTGRSYRTLVGAARSTQWRSLRA